MSPRKLLVEPQGPAERAVGQPGNVIDGQVDHLKSVYAQIDARMKSLPICHPALSVETVGFVPCDEGRLGVLVTPWCMNLVFVPPPGTHAEGERTFGLPAGPVTLTWQELEGFGSLGSKSVFSPMAQFPDQATAIETARELMRTLLAAPAPEKAPPATKASRRELFMLFRKRA